MNLSKQSIMIAGWIYREQVGVAYDIFHCPSFFFCQTLHLLTVYVEGQLSAGIFKLSAFSCCAWFCLATGDPPLWVIHAGAGKRQHVGGCSSQTGKQLILTKGIKNVLLKCGWYANMTLCCKAKFVQCVFVVVCTCVWVRCGVQNISLSISVKSKKQQKLEKDREMLELENHPLSSSCLCLPVEEAVWGHHLMDRSHMHLMAIKKKMVGPLPWRWYVKCVVG